MCSKTLLSQVITSIKDSSYLATSNMYNGVGTQMVSDVFVLFGVAFAIYFVINFTLSCVVRSLQKRRPKQTARAAAPAAAAR